MKGEDFYAWLKKVTEAAAGATDSCLIASERRKYDKKLIELTTPQAIVDMVNFIGEWLPEKEWQRLKEQREKSIPTCAER